MAQVDVQPTDGKADPGPLVRVVMGREGERTRDGVTYASFTGTVGEDKHRYLMDYDAWTEADRPTIITVTVEIGVQA